MQVNCRKLLLLIAPLLFVSVTVQAQLIKHTYRFYNTLAVAPPECGPDLVQAQALGSCNPVATGGSFITDTLPHCGVTRTVYHNNMQWGLLYPNTTGTITNTYTIHLYVKTTDFGTRTWARIIDFSNGTSDAGIYYRASGGSPDRCLDFYPNGIVGACPYFNDSTYYLLTFTRNGATGIIDVYVNNTLFVSYNDAANRYVGVTGVPIYIYRDDQVVSCESGEANFAYLSFTNQYSSQATVNAVYNDICSIANTATSADFDFSAAAGCNLSQNVTVTYTGDIPAPGTGYLFNWNFDGGTIVSGTGIGPYVINWATPGIKNVSLTVSSLACGNPNTHTQQISISSPTASTINQTICEGESYLGYTASGTYVDVLVNSFGCDSVRTLNLTVNPISRSDIFQTICSGETYLGYAVTGNYNDTFTAANGCDSIRTLHLTVNPITFVTIDQTICEGNSYDGYTTSGIYVDTLTGSNGCDSIRTLNLEVIPLPNPDLGADKQICTGDTLVLYPGLFNSYLWQDGSTLDHFVVRQPGNFSVQVSNSCGAGSDDITVIEISCDIYFPSAFTPNGDGKNDLFKMLGPSNVSGYSLTVYNRWGEKVFETKNPTAGWDGKVAGKWQEVGVYVWYAGYRRDNKEFQRKGTVSLIR